ncbi:MAG: hypothetical protein WC001_04920 [Desulfurivibrionaceae bacterium]
MQVIVYGSEEISVLSLVEAIHSLAPAAKVETCAGFSRCEAMLVEAGTGEVVMVVLVVDREELARMFSLRERFMETPLVLVLPDDSGETVRMGHRLRPRFVGFFSRGFSDVAAVVARLLARTCQVSHAGS